MKPNLLISLLLLGGMAFASCSSGDDPDPTPGPVPPPPSEPYFTAEVLDTCGFGYRNGTLSFLVDTNQEFGQWSVTSDAAWCRPSRSSFEFTIEVEAYDPEEEGRSQYVVPRECHVTVQSGTLYRRTFLVRQESRTVIYGLPDVTVPLEMNADGERKDLPLYHNCLEIRPTSTASWIAVSLIDNQVLSVVTSPRPAGQPPRSAEVQVASAYSEGVCRFTVKDADATLEPENYR